VVIIKMIFSRLQKPDTHAHITTNLLRASIWGLLGSGTAALASTVFGRSLMQEGSWKALAPPIFKASLTSCGTFAAVTACILYKMTGHIHDWGPTCPSFNYRVSLFAKRSTLVGLFGAAALKTKFLKINKEWSERLVYPLLGLGLAGLTLRLFQIYQNRQLSWSPRWNTPKLKQE
jgi:hypothetical protein